MAPLTKRYGAAGTSTIWAVIASGVHLFPFRTEKLSPTAPMVLGAQAPGRVGRRRITSEGPRERPFFIGAGAGSAGADPARAKTPEGVGFAAAATPHGPRGTGSPSTIRRWS